MGTSDGSFIGKYSLEVSRREFAMNEALNSACVILGNQKNELRLGKKVHIRSEFWNDLFYGNERKDWKRMR